jgi:hypothetical protein
MKSKSDNNARSESDTEETAEGSNDESRESSSNDAKPNPDCGTLEESEVNVTTDTARTDSPSEDVPSEVSEQTRSRDDDARCLRETRNPEEQCPDNGSRQSDIISRDTFLEYPQIRPGAVAVAGPDRDERDEQRHATPKRILAGQLQDAAERANAGTFNDGTRPFGTVAQPGAIAVAGPGAEDVTGDVQRIVTPKRILAEHLQNEAERVETTHVENENDVLDQRDEVSNIENLHPGDAVADRHAAEGYRDVVRGTNHGTDCQDESATDDPKAVREDESNVQHSE